MTENLPQELHCTVGRLILPVEFMITRSSFLLKILVRYNELFAQLSFNEIIDVHDEKILNP